MIKYYDMSTYNEYMCEAINEAIRAAELDEVPVGALIVKDGEIIARAHNMVESLGSPTAHAEMIAISEATGKLGKWLDGCTMYVTLEPCAMCAGAIVLSRLDRLCIGAMDSKTGACGSLRNIVCDERLNHKVELTVGIEAEVCSKLLKDFFRKRRK